MKKAIVLLCTILISISAFTGCHPTFDEPTSTEPSQPSITELTYNAAITLLDQGNYAVARDKLRKCTGYKDADKLLACFVVRRDQEIKKSTYNHDGTSSTSETRTEYTYDQYGNILLEKWYFGDGTLAQSAEYQYDAQGNTTHYFVYNGDGSLNSSQILQFNEQGHKNRWTYYIAREDVTIVYTYTYEYDDSGRILCIKTFYENGTLLETVKRQYDDYGNVTFYSRADGSGKLQQKDNYKFTYDENGHIIHEDRYIINGKLHSTHDYVYDQNGNVLSEIAYYADGKLMEHVTYTYDEYNFITSETEYDIDGNITKLIEYKYEGATLYFNPYLK